MDDLKYVYIYMLSQLHRNNTWILSICCPFSSLSLVVSPFGVSYLGREVPGGAIDTPSKMNSERNLQPSHMKRKENDLNHPPPWNFVPAVNLQGCTCIQLH